SFYKALAKEIENAALSVTHVRANAQVDFVASSTPSAIVEKLKMMAARNQAIALVSPDYPAVTAAIEELKERGVPVFALLSDFAAGVREGYIGLNNQKVGRTAAWMIVKAAKRPGKVAAFVGSHRFHGHELREIGFRSYFRENAPDFEVLDMMVNLDTPDITHEATLDLLQRHPDLLGFYVCGGGMEGAISAIREEKLGGKLLAVVNELTPESRAGLTDETVLMAISTPVPALARETIDLMIGAIDRGASSVPGQTFLPFDIYTPENI
ncbi:substrate-binding domain-containing protein, partial [Sinorhizobium meliloti]|uniref:substrate-binding domain-containing protein n=1 Tax=Rhizobium meliloti TaxID=382 RepID=UPI000FDAF897